MEKVVLDLIYYNYNNYKKKNLYKNGISLLISKKLKLPQFPSLFKLIYYSRPQIYPPYNSTKINKN